MCKNKKLIAALTSFQQLGSFSITLGIKNNIDPTTLDEILQFKLVEFVTAFDAVEDHKEFYDLIARTDKNQTRKLIATSQITATDKPEE